MHKNGFTLVELMVVVALIGILSIIGAASYNESQKGSRDSHRKRDIESIAAALEQQYNSFSGYPVLDPIYFSEGEIPADPGGFHYWFNGGNSESVNFGQIFVICANLERDTGNYADKDGATLDETGSFYCVKSQQGK